AHLVLVSRRTVDRMARRRALTRIGPRFGRARARRVAPDRRGLARVPPRGRLARRPQCPQRAARRGRQAIPDRIRSRPAWTAQSPARAPEPRAAQALTREGPRDRTRALLLARGLAVVARRVLQGLIRVVGALEAAVDP